MSALPETKTLLLSLDRSVLHVTLNRPEARNAMSLTMLRELEEVFAAIETRRDVRTVVIRGVNGVFCAGGDVKDMAGARMQERTPERDPIFEVNRAFGRTISRVEMAPQVVVTVCEGPVLGGGFGLACVADVTLVEASAELGLPETSLGLPPAQIAPFVVARVGLSQARRLALTAARFSGREALAIGIAHEVAEGTEALEAALAKTLAQIARCAPSALAVTKSILRNVGSMPREALLDEGARRFAECVRSEEGTEGTMAFIQKRKPNWDDRETSV
jgi:isohexenylglutaconyl-CoA hydratase